MNQSLEPIENKTMNTKQEEMQFLGIFGVYKEAFKLIFNYRIIFSQITLIFILPLSFLFLAEEKISELISYNLQFNEFVLSDEKSGTPKYTKLSSLVSSEWAIYITLKIIYFTFLLIFSLFSTSAVVYTVASVYTSQEVTFKKVLKAVPKVWKRLALTFLCAFVAFFTYNTCCAMILYFWSKSTEDTWFTGLTALVTVLVFYSIGFVYMTIIWLLASVVSVLEDSYGFKAMIKSKNLIKRKMVVAIFIFFKLNFGLMIIYVVYHVRVVYAWRGNGILTMIAFAVLCLLLLCKLILFALVVLTVIYFVCKAYHKENINMSTLSAHLDVYLGVYVPLISKDVQMMEYEVKIFWK